MDQISIPPPITLAKPRDWDEIDGPMPVKIKFQFFIFLFLPLELSNNIFANL